MRLDPFKQSLCESAARYAEANGIPIDSTHASALIFENLADNFCPASWREIQRCPDWFARTRKPHTNVSGIREMQSSNSSDALLMNVFCHPKLPGWKGVAKVLGFAPVEPVFGFKARVAKHGTNGDATEIDVAVGDCFIEAKLTEAGFTAKPREEVNRYRALAQVFHVEVLPQTNGGYENYQVIRNLLAAVQHHKRHLLLCDERRPDLIIEYMRTVWCMREPLHRANCGVVTWQDLARATGRELKEFLEARYGIA